MSDAVRIERQGAVTTVILERPEARNAVDPATAEQLAAAFREFERDDALRGRGAVGRRRHVLRRRRSQGGRGGRDGNRLGALGDRRPRADGPDAAAR